MKNKVAVTGSCGFIGHWLVRGLKKRGYTVVGVDSLIGGTKEYANEADEFLLKDVRELTAGDLEGCKYVFHTAALPKINYSWEHPEETESVNVLGTVRVLLAAMPAGVEKVVYSSSSSVYGNQKTVPYHEDMAPNPLSPYAVQKLAGELYCEAYRMAKQIETASLRYFNVFGEEQRADNPYTGVLTIFREQYKKKEPLTVTGDGRQTRDFTFVGDVVEANIIAAEKGSGVYNVGTGMRYSINELADCFGGGRRYIPPRPAEAQTSLAQNLKLKNLGWKPTKGVREWISEKKRWTTQ